MKTAIVITTVNPPEVVRSYAENARQYGHKDVGFIVVGDRKTPHEEARRIVAEARWEGFEAEYWDVERQEAWLAQFPALAPMIPWNSDNRRNVGFLVALERGAATIISTDDDNFAIPEWDFFGEHAIVGQAVEIETLGSSNGWVNPCGLLQFEPPVRVYSRGYPFGKRWRDKPVIGRGRGRVVVNLGLWLGEPDIDAVTRLACPVTSLGLTSERLMLAADCLMPVNTQNTAVHRDAMAAFYFVLQGVEINGMPMDRYGDIWAGFFLNKIAAHLGDRLTLGPPLVQHSRNDHDLLQDLENEFWGMLLTEHLVPVIESARLTAGSYCDAYRELAEVLRTYSPHPHPAVRDYMERLCAAMTAWADACERLSAGRPAQAASLA
ncbi:MAG: hypothetical protein HYY03_06825 [Chloroflexi bacterium]|nr:hypothetical protein [Chloroflexota bacterium]